MQLISNPPVNRDISPFTYTPFKTQPKAADIPVAPEAPVEVNAAPVEPEVDPKVQELVEQLPAAVDPDAPVEEAAPVADAAPVEPEVPAAPEAPVEGKHGDFIES